MKADFVKFLHVRRYVSNAAGQVSLATVPFLRRNGLIGYLLPAGGITVGVVHNPTTDAYGVITVQVSKDDGYNKKVGRRILRACFRHLNTRHEAIQIGVVTRAEAPKQAGSVNNYDYAYAWFDSIENCVASLKSAIHCHQDVVYEKLKPTDVYQIRRNDFNPGTEQEVKSSLFRFCIVDSAPDGVTCSFISCVPPHNRWSSPAKLKSFYLTPDNKTALGLTNCTLITAREEFTVNMAPRRAAKTTPTKFSDARSSAAKSRARRALKALRKVPVPLS